MHKFIVFIFFICTTLFAGAQISIKGRVLDGRSGTPVVNASVYLNNTSVGTVTNKQGEFLLNVKSIYTGELIVSSVGYHTLSYKLNQADADSSFFTFKLEIKESVMVGILVMSDAQRRQWLKIFKENFLGMTEEADNCIIENPDAVYFTAGENKNSMYAYADTALVITNPMLGYKISFDLIEFSFDNSKNSTYFLGYSRYEEMGEKKRWIKLRKQNYFGSTMHFYRSLTADRLKQEGFSIFEVRRIETKEDSLSKLKKNTPPSGGYLMAAPVKPNQILERDSAADKFYLIATNQIMVQYNEIPHSRYYLASKVLVRGLNRFGFTAYITLLSKKVEIDDNGIIHSPMAVVYDGFWVYEKLANQLPFNYQPE